MLRSGGVAAPKDLPPGERSPRFGVKSAFLLFGGWLFILLGALLLEEVGRVRAVFDGAAVGYLYLALQSVTGLAALAACLSTLARGSNQDRVLVVVPTLVLVGYALMVFAGPG